MKFLIIALSLIIISCKSGNVRERVLTTDEMQKYHLNGIIHDAEICQHFFDEKNKKLQNTGQCEIVNCDQIQGKIVCTVRQKN